MSNEKFRRDLNKVFDDLAGIPSPTFGDRVRSSIVEAPQPPSYFWVAGVAAFLIAALVVGVTLIASPLKPSLIPSGSTPSPSAAFEATSPSPSPPAAVPPSYTSSCVATPPARASASLVLDSARRQVIMFGGDGSTGPLNDTWIWTVRPGPCWTEVHPSASPPTRANAAIAFDPVRKLTVMYGGVRAEPGKSVVVLNDMWTWDGGNWRNVQPNPSPVLISPVSAFDVARGQLVLFGYNEGQPETWVWNGAQWRHLHPESTPGARSSSSMAYDNASQLVLLFGGRKLSGGTSTDTWTWDGTDWTMEREPSRYPGAPGVLCGGSPLILVAPVGLIDKTWFWELSDWKGIEPQHTLPPRSNTACTFTGPEVVLFGGSDGSQFLSDTWLFRSVDWVRGG